MRKLAILVLSSALAAAVVGSKVTETASPSATPHVVEEVLQTVAKAPAGAVAAARYRINTGQSRFMVRAFSGGVLWFMSHDHIFAVRDFTGDIEAAPGTLTPASLQIRIRADSLEETREFFTPQEKQIINKQTRQDVLETAAYPEIVFKSTAVSAEKIGENQYEAEIGGDLTLHGVTRHVVIPAHVSVTGDGLRANGEFSINRSDYNVKTQAIKWGTIRMRDRVKFSFDIIANKL